MNKKYIAYVLALAVLLIGGIIFHEQLRAYLSSVHWVSVVSMGIFFAGSLYAITERNLLVGIAAFVTALVLPRVSAWMIAYWPWIAKCYFTRGH